jgi:hypothetical protein
MHENKEGIFIKLNMGNRIFVYQFKDKDIRNEWIFAIRSANE